MSTAPNALPFVSARNLLRLGMWLLALLGILQVHQFDGLFGHAICGPWGCGPPVSALVGYHGFWFLLLVPLAILLKSSVRSESLRNLGLGLLLLSGLGVVSLLLLDGLNNSAAERYLLQWCAFRIATFVDVPLVQLGLVGVWMFFATPQNHDKQAIVVEADRDA